jgi:hypothetical protein
MRPFPEAEGLVRQAGVPRVAWRVSSFFSSSFEIANLHIDDQYCSGYPDCSNSIAREKHLYSVNSHFVAKLGNYDPRIDDTTRKVTHCLCSS